MSKCLSLSSDFLNRDLTGIYFSFSQLLEYVFNSEQDKVSGKVFWVTSVTGSGCLTSDASEKEILIYLYATSKWVFSVISTWRSKPIFYDSFFEKAKELKLYFSIFLGTMNLISMMAYWGQSTASEVVLSFATQLYSYSCTLNPLLCIY